MSILLKYAAIVLLTVSFCEASTVVIGNGGEGYRIDNKIYVRDLVENSVYLNPYFGSESSKNYIQGFDQTLLQSLNLDVDLLNQKLNDIDSVFRGLADTLVSVSHLYSWNLIDESLALLPDDGEIIQIPYQERVQIANRSFLSIRLQKKLWKSLSPQNQVALLVHELIYALMKPVPLNSQNLIFTQSARVARQITGQFFMPSLYRNSENQKTLVNLIQLAFDVQTTDLEKRVQLRLILDTNGQSYQLMTMYEPVAVGDLLPRLIQVCDYLQGFENYVLRGTSMMDIFEIRSAQFQSQYGTEVSMQIQSYSSAKSFEINSFQIQKDRCSVSLDRWLL